MKCVGSCSEKHKKDIPRRIASFLFLIVVSHQVVSDSFETVWIVAH